MQYVRWAGAFGTLLGLWTSVALAGRPVLEGPPQRPLTEPASLISPTREGAAPLPVVDLHAIPEIMDAVWTPDGKELVLSANLSGRLNLWKLALPGGTPVRLTTSEERQWGVQVSPDGAQVLYNQDRGGAEIFDLHAVPRAGGESVNLTQTPEVSETDAVYSPDGRWLAFASRGRTEPSNNVAVMALATRETRLLTREASSDMQWSVVGFAPGSRQLYANRADVRGTRSTVWRIDVRSGKAVPLGAAPASAYVAATAISPDGHYLAVNAETAAGRKQAALLDVRRGQLRFLQDDEWEQRAGHFSPDGRQLLFTRQEDGRDVMLLHDIVGGTTRQLPLPAGINSDWFGKQPSFSPDGRQLLFPHQAGGTPVDYWTLDLQSQALSRATHLLPPSMANAALPETRIVRYRSADGTVISAVLWMPFNLPRDGKAPAVVIAHGGPTGQTEDRFDITAAALASRGYMVIAPNPRGSTGYGRAFMEANRGDLGGGDLEDYVAATDFLVASGYVDRARIGITGISYGGYMTLIALGKTPGVWAAGVQICGITNWLSIYERGSPVLRDYLQGLMGDPVKDKAAYEASSPLTYLQHYRAPLLSLQGENDPRVPRYEAELVTGTLQQLGRVVEAKYYPEEGHGFFKRENQIDSVQRLVDWFERYLRQSDAVERLAWMESPRDKTALDWAKSRTAEARAALESRPGYAQILGELQGALRAGTPVPPVSLLGPRAVRLLQDAAHPHGLLQVAKRGRGGLGEWRTVLDVGALREKEGKPYVLQWYAPRESCLPPDHARCLLRLSPAGADDVEIREFDLELGKFVEDGFRVPASRAMFAWIDIDHVAIAHTVGEQPLTAAGWAAALHFWQRGDPLSAAREVFRAEPTDALLQISAVGTGPRRRIVAVRAIDFSTFDMKLLSPDGRVEQVALPQRLKPFGVMTMTDRHLVVQLAEDAVIEGRTHAAETLLSYDTLASGSSSRVQVIAAPGPAGILSDMTAGIAGTRDAVTYVLWRDLLPRLHRAEPDSRGRWQTREVGSGQAGESLRIADADREGTDIVLTTTGFLTPTRHDLYFADGRRKSIAAEAAVVDAARYTVEVRQARARDGIAVPYYLLRPKTAGQDGPTPTLMTGYGAFGISITPAYFDFAVGGRALKLWLERGGALVIPAIRGGGEQGAEWHRAAMRDKRLVSYDDFAMVTEALIASGFTTPAHLGVFGMSNGGLLAATMGTRRPDLYAAVVSDVPLADMLRFPKMGMGAAWMDEYGNPEDPAMATVLRSYSPVHAVKDGVRYPAFLVTVSTEDNRVGPGHARKLAARLQAVGATAYLIEDDEGGHGVSDPLQRPELMAQRMTFLIDTLMGRSK